MYIFMEFELTDEEISQIKALEAELEAKLNSTFFQAVNFAIDRNSLYSECNEKISKIRKEARKRSLTYYSSHIAELKNALREELRKRAVLIFTLERADNHPAPLDLWKNYAAGSISPYLALLSPKYHSDILNYMDYVFTNREKIYEEAQKNRKSKTGYVNMFNGPGVNNGIRAAQRRMKRTEKITSTGIETVGEQSISGVLVELSNFDRVNLTDITRRILCILLIKLTEKAPYGAGVTDEQIAKARGINLSLDEYMSFCGLNDRKEAQKQLRNNAYTLFNLSMTWDEESYEINPATRRKKRKKIHWSTRLFDSTREVMNLDEDPVIDSTITFNFTYDIVKYLCQKYIMPFNLRALSINPHKNPYASLLAYKLMEHYNENISKHKHIRISVETLLKACPDMLTPEEVRENAKSKYWERIREPFERDMIALRDVYCIIEEWHYCNSGGEELTDEQKTKCKFKEWLQWLVEYTLKDYQVQQKPKAHRQKKNSKPKAIALSAKAE